MRFLKIFLFIGYIPFFLFSFLYSIEAAPSQETLAKKAMKAYNKQAKKKPNNKVIAIVIDADTGKVLYEEKGYFTHYPASMTKMMTLYLIFEQLKKGKLRLTDKLRVSKNAASKKPGKINLIAGETISVRDAIIGSIVKSANDAATVLGEALGKTERRFATLMTQKAKKLGMKKTQFRNPTGWHDPEQISSPYDMAILARALLKDFPEYYKLFGIKQFTYKNVSYHNTNKLLDKVKGCDGIKTGFFTDPVGCNITASAKRDNKRVIAVVMGGRTGKERNIKTVELIEKGFDLLKKYSTALKNTPKEDVAEIMALPPTKPSSSKDNTSSPEFDRLVETLEKDLQTNIAPKKKVLSSKKLPFKKTKELPSPPSQVFPLLASADSPRWSVQVGAFNTLQTAKTEAEKLFASYPSLLKKDFLQIAQTPKKKFFPIRFTNLQKSQADLICKQLQQDRKPCIIISPRA